MLNPIFTMFHYFPLRAYSTVFIMALISAHAFQWILRRCEAGTLSRWRGMMGWLLTNYILLLLFFTVFGRRSLDYYRYNFEAGYSYQDVWTTGDSDMALQIAVNIAAFIPVGVLGSLATKRWRFLKGLLLGMGLSLCIELLQLVMRNGTCEIDDLISNSLGTLLGCGIAGVYCLFRHRYCKDMRRKKDEKSLSDCTDQ